MCYICNPQRNLTQCDGQCQYIIKYQKMRASRCRPPHHDGQLLQNINTTLYTKIVITRCQCQCQYIITWQSMRALGTATTSWPTMSVSVSIHHNMMANSFRTPILHCIPQYGITRCGGQFQYIIVYQSMRTSGSRPPHHHDGLGEQSDVIIPSVIPRFGVGQCSIGAVVVPPAPAERRRTVFAAAPIVVPITC